MVEKLRGSTDGIFARIMNGDWMVSAAALVGYVFLLSPLIVVIGTAFNRDAVAFPPTHLSLKWFMQVLRSPEFLQAAKVSFLLATVAAATATLFSIPVSFFMRRLPPVLRAVVSGAFLGPLLVPSVVLALGLYQIVFFMTHGTSLVGMLIGHIVVTMPFPLRTIAAVTERLDPSLEDAAASVGATPFQTLMKVTLPLAKSGIIAGALFAFIASWNDFPISIFLAPPQGVPLPIKIYGYLRYEYNPLIAAISTYLVVLSVALIYGIEKLVGLSAFMWTSKQQR